MCRIVPFSSLSQCNSTPIYATTDVHIGAHECAVMPSDRKWATIFRQRQELSDKVRHGGVQWCVVSRSHVQVLAGMSSAY